MNESNNKSGNKEIWGCVGVIGAALIAGIVAIIIALPSLAPFFSQSRPPIETIASPIVQSTPITQPSIECISPKDLAIQKGWTDMGWADEKYCGLRVNLSNSDELPLSWEAIGASRIYQGDKDRNMSSGVWSIYPPFSCRVILGCSQ